MNMSRLVDFADAPAHRVAVVAGHLGDLFDGLVLVDVELSPFGVALVLVCSIHNSS